MLLFVGRKTVVGVAALTLLYSERLQEILLRLLRITHRRHAHSTDSTRTKQHLVLGTPTEGAEAETDASPLWLPSLRFIPDVPHFKPGITLNESPLFKAAAGLIQASSSIALHPDLACLVIEQQPPIKLRPAQQRRRRHRHTALGSCLYDLVHSL